MSRLKSAHIPPSLRRSILYQHDGASPDCRTHIREKYLNITFGQWCIGHNGPVNWLARSPECKKFHAVPLSDLQDNFVS
ncbi:hypothetical protein TNCV_3672931 [Trichonephila clavipes]|nr:hypothetical protein TNCV_3672931 [Trichonephila clavipes]